MRKLGMIMILIVSNLLFLFSVDKAGIIIQVDIKPLIDQGNGIISGLEKSGYTKDKLEIITYNAGNKMESIKDITEKLKSAGVKMIFSIGTSASLETLKYVKDIPVVCSVSYAESLADAGKKFGYGKNYTAVLMYVPATPLIKLALKIKNYKTFGMIYAKNEDNAQKEVANLKKSCDALGLQVKALPYSDENSIVETLNNLVNSSIDCYIIVKDTFLVKHFPEIKQIIYDKKIVTLGFDEASVNQDLSIMGLSVNYTLLGEALAQKAIEIFKGKKPSDIIPLPMEKYEIVMNLKTAKAIGINLPVEIIRAAKQIIK